MTYDNSNRGIVYAPPIFSGTINVQSVPHFIWIWSAVSKKGTSFYSVKISRTNEIPAYVPNSNANKGVLFVNEKKQNEKSPDFSGSINVNGKDMNLSAWRFGFSDLTLIVSEKMEYGSRPAKPMRERDPDPFIDDDISF